MTRRPRPALVVLALSLTALAVAGVAAGASVMAQEEVPASVGSRPTATVTPAPSASSPQPPVATAGPSAAASVGAGFTEIPQPTFQAPVAPARVDIPAVDVSAVVVPTGVDREGLAEIPEDVDVLGWYRFGSAPLDPDGSTVVVGHRDGRDQGRGALYRLGGVAVGDRVVVVLEDGSRVAYRVVAREVLDKDVVPLGELFERDGDRRLTLISCGGAYDRARGGYQANVVVTAVPV